MHIGGAIQGLQHVVYDAAVESAEPVAPAVPAAAASGGVSGGSTSDAGRQPPQNRVYHPVTDLIDRLALERQTKGLRAATGAFGAPVPAPPNVDVTA